MGTTNVIRHLHLPSTISLAMQKSIVDESPVHPELCVFDLDACLWDQEMFSMPSIPSQTVIGDLNGRGEGIIGVMSGPHQISLNKGSIVALQEHADNVYPGMKIALASSADTLFAEKIGRAALKMLEVLPSLTIWDLLMRDWDGVDVNQIGRKRMAPWFTAVQKGTLVMIRISWSSDTKIILKLTFFFLLNKSWGIII